MPNYQNEFVTFRHRVTKETVRVECASMNLAYYKYPLHTWEPIYHEHWQYQVINGKKVNYQLVGRPVEHNVAFGYI